MVPSPIGYLEGIYVAQGVFRELLTVCENFAKMKGYTEFAGDCAPCNVYASP